jgi:hypothetical protein
MFVQWNKRKLAVSACYGLFWIELVGLVWIYYQTTKHVVVEAADRPPIAAQSTEPHFEEETRGEFFISSTPHLLLYGVLSVLAFEFLSFCTLHSGRTYQQQRVEVCEITLSSL